MIPWFFDLNPITQALLATFFTWFVTAVGASLVFLLKDMNRKIFDGMLGFAAGVMLAASYWSLLSPALELSKNDMMSWLPVAIGFLLGGIFIRIIDIILPHLHPNLPPVALEGPKTKLKKSNLLVLAITIHNIPEGLAIGVAFGAASLGLPEATLGAAISLAIGIGLQNFPEGLAVAMPLKQEGYSTRKSFFYGQLSASVEPVAGVLGAIFVFMAQPLLPYALSFAAGAMIFVVAEEVIPESHRRGNIDLATFFLLFGFVLMMILDVSLT
ncbi:MAG: ZIP family metal transporter [Nitrososphaeraceae archaeon]